MRAASTLSPGESVLVSAGFPAAGARAREDEHLAGLGLEHLLQVANSGSVSAGKSGARMSSIGRSSARRTASGMLVGPGMNKPVGSASACSPGFGWPCAPADRVGVPYSLGLAHAMTSTHDALAARQRKPGNPHRTMSLAHGPAEAPAAAGEQSGGASRRPAGCLNFTRAGEELALTQSAVSRQIQLLEEHLGTALFQRQGRSLQLTRDGAAAAPRGRPWASATSPTSRSTSAATAAPAS